MVSVFFSYSHADEAMRDQIDKQLSILKRQGVISVWHDRRIGAGEEFAQAIDTHVQTDDIILLLVSHDFLASDYCYEIEMRKAMERHDAGTAIVIPVILRACEWKQSPLGKLNATPPDGRPISQYPDRDEAMLKVAEAIRAAARRLDRQQGAVAPAAASSHRTTPIPSFTGSTPVRSSNLVLAKSFTERDRDHFKLDTFEYMAKFFENSLAELGERNPGIEGQFRRIDGNRFSALVYRNGQAIARCAIFMGDRFLGSGIAYSSQDIGTNSYNEMLTVDADDQTLFLTSMGMQMTGRRDGASKLTQEGAAELYWSMLIAPLQRN